MKILKSIIIATLMFITPYGIHLLLKHFGVDLNTKPTEGLLILGAIIFGVFSIVEAGAAVCFIWDTHKKATIIVGSALALCSIPLTMYLTKIPPQDAGRILVLGIITIMMGIAMVLGALGLRSLKAESKGSNE